MNKPLIWSKNSSIDQVNHSYINKKITIQVVLFIEIERVSKESGFLPKKVSKIRTLKFLELRQLKKSVLKLTEIQKWTTILQLDQTISKTNMSRAAKRSCHLFSPGKKFCSSFLVFLWENLLIWFIFFVGFYS